MPRFSDRSLYNLNTCDTRLIVLFGAVIKQVDCTVLCGHRDEETQNEAFRQGFSQVQWPDSKHNPFPALAADVVPYPIDWEAWERNYAFGGFVLGVAANIGIKIRWGGDWDGDWQMREHSFIDLPHFEVVLEIPEIPTTREA
jgi:hypothetical protein